KSIALQPVLERAFWDAKAKQWRDGFDPTTNTPIDSISQHTTALAMLLRLKPETHPLLARDVLIKSANSSRTKILTASPFFYAYVLDALAESNFREELVRIIRNKWGAMLDGGATTFWEVWDPMIESRC